MNYFEYYERRAQQSVAVDVIDWPGIAVTESEPNDGQLLEFSLMTQSVNIPKEDVTK